MSNKAIWNAKPAKRFFREAEKIKFPSKELMKELLAMHSGRKVRSLKGGKVSPAKLREAVVLEQGCRSRCIEIYMEASKVLSLLTDLQSVVSQQLMMESADLIPADTKTERKDFLRRGFRKKAPIVLELENIKETATHIMEDIDKAAWALKLIVSTFEISTRPEISL